LVLADPAVDPNNPNAQSRLIYVQRVQQFIPPSYSIYDPFAELNARRENSPKFLQKIPIMEYFFDEKYGRKEDGDYYINDFFLYIYLFASVIVLPFRNESIPNLVSHFPPFLGQSFMNNITLSSIPPLAPPSAGGNAALPPTSLSANAASSLTLVPLPVPTRRTFGPAPVGTVISLSLYLLARIMHFGATDGHAALPLPAFSQKMSSISSGVSTASSSNSSIVSLISSPRGRRPLHQFLADVQIFRNDFTYGSDGLINGSFWWKDGFVGWEIKIIMIITVFYDYFYYDYDYYARY
jgi:hypothetical protein